MTPSKKQRPDGLVALLDPEVAIYQLAAHLARLNGKHPRDYESSMWRRMCSAIRRGDLPIRAFPEWFRVAPDEAFREDGGLYGYSEKGHAMSVADLHKWLVDEGVPATANAKGLWKILEQEEAPTPETQTGTQEDVTPEDQIITPQERIGAKKVPTPEQMARFNERVAVNWDTSNNRAMITFSDWLYEQEGGGRVTPKTLGKYVEVNFVDHVLIPTDECKKVWAEKGMMENNDDGK